MASTVRGSRLWVLAAAALMMITVAPVEAQIPGAAPDVNIICDPIEVELTSHPDRDRSSTSHCTATNPTLYAEVVGLQIVSPMSFSAPGSIAVNPGGSAEFNVTFTADPRDDAGDTSAKLIYEVQTVNGVSNPNPQPKEISWILTIERYALPEVAGPEWFKLDGGGEGTYEYTLTNLGNAQDRFHLSVGEIDGWSFVLDQSEVILDPAAEVTITLTALAPRGAERTDHDLLLLAESEFDGTTGVASTAITRTEGDGATVAGASTSGASFWDHDSTTLFVALSGVVALLVLIVLALRWRARQRARSVAIASARAGRRARATRAGRRRRTTA